MKMLGALGIAVVFACAGTARALEGSEGSKPSDTKPGVAKSVYNIENGSARVTTTIENDYSNDSKMQGYLFPNFRRALQATPFVTSVQQTVGEESVEKLSYADYDMVKKKSHSFVSITATSPLTLLFEVEESYRKCKPGTKLTDDNGGTSISTSCSKETKLTVRGPLAVYGNFASAINVDALLRNKQEFETTLGKNYLNKDTILASTFNVKSVSFDESLARFFKVFNIPVYGEGNEIGFAGGLMDKISPLTTRQRLLLGISRITRQANERMLSL